MFRLHVVPNRGDPFDHAFEGDSLVVGRSSEADLTLADRGLSRRHARLYGEGDALMVEDLGSHNGTLLNGERIDRPTAVGAGDVIQIANSLISLDAASEAGAALTTEADAHPSTTVFRPASNILAEPGPAHVGDEAVGRYIERLRIVNEIHQALSRPISLQKLLDLILDRVFEHLRPEEGVVLLKKGGGDYVRAASRLSPGLEREYLYSRSLVHEVVEKGMAVLVLDARTDDRFAEAPSVLESGVRSVVAAPLLDAEGCLGMIALNSRLQVRQFTEGDRDLLTSLASAAALRIRNVALAEEAAERKRLDEAVALARQIQIGLLPDRLPDVLGYELHGGNIPSQGVSGDYYEVVERLDGQECVLMVVDVSGKGLAAALLTACLEALSESPIEAGLPPDEICTRLSRSLYLRTSPEKFATAFLAVLEPATGRVRYANAGHNPPLLLRAARGVELLPATGVPLGILPAAAYSAGEVVLAPGDTLVLYTDGIVEAIDPGEQEYGLDRLTEVCLRERRARLKLLARAIEADLDAFVQGVPFADDRTLVLARRREEGTQKQS